jgi:ribosomal protein S27AE
MILTFIMAGDYLHNNNLCPQCGNDVIIFKNSVTHAGRLSPKNHSY